MSKNIAALALAAVMSTAVVVPVAHADRDGRHHYREHHANKHHGRHRGRGYYKNGKWIALGIIGAAAAAAIANADRDCYYRHGRRYCDY